MTMTRQRTLHDIVTTARECSGCTRCNAPAGGGCNGTQGGIHLRRVVAARLGGVISETDAGLVFHEAGVFGDGTIVPDPGSRS